MKNTKKLFISGLATLSIVISGLSLSALISKNDYNNQPISMFNSIVGDEETKSNKKVPEDGEGYFEQDDSFGGTTSTSVGMTYYLSRNDYDNIKDRSGDKASIVVKVNGGIFGDDNGEPITVFEIDKNDNIIWTKGYEDMFEYIGSVDATDNWSISFIWHNLNPGTVSSTNISIYNLDLEEGEQTIAENTPIEGETEMGRFELAYEEYKDEPTINFETKLSDDKEHYDLDFSFRTKYGENETKYYDQNYNWSEFSEDKFLDFNINYDLSTFYYEVNGIGKEKSFNSIFDVDNVQIETIPGENPWNETFEYTFSTELPPNETFDINKISISVYDEPFVIKSVYENNILETINTDLLPYNLNNVEASGIVGARSSDELFMMLDGVKSSDSDENYEAISKLSIKLIDAENIYGKDVEIPDSGLFEGNYNSSFNNDGVSMEGYVFNPVGLTPNTRYNKAELYVNDETTPEKVIDISNVETLPIDMDFSTIEERDIEYNDDDNEININIDESWLKENLSPTRLTIVDGNNTKSNLRVPDTLVMTTRYDETASFDSNFDPLENVEATASYDNVEGNLKVSLSGLEEGVYYNVEGLTIYDDGSFNGIENSGVTSNSLELNHEFYSNLDPFNASNITIDGFEMDNENYLNSELTLKLNIPENLETETSFKSEELSSILDSEGNEYEIDNFDSTSNEAKIKIPSNKIGKSISFDKLTYNGEVKNITPFTCNTVKLFNDEEAKNDINITINSDEIKTKDDVLKLTFSSKTNLSYYSAEEAFTTTTINGKEYKLEKSKLKNSDATYEVVDFELENGQSIEISSVNDIAIPEGTFDFNEIEIKSFPWWIVGGTLILVVVLILIIIITSIILVKRRRTREYYQ